MTPVISMTGVNGLSAGYIHADQMSCCSMTAAQNLAAKGGNCGVVFITDKLHPAY